MLSRACTEQAPGCVVLLTALASSSTRTPPSSWQFPAAALRAVAAGRRGEPRQSRVGFTLPPTKAISSSRYGLPAGHVEELSLRNIKGGTDKTRAVGFPTYALIHSCQQSIFPSAALKRHRCGVLQGQKVLDTSDWYLN